MTLPKVFLLKNNSRGFTLIELLIVIAIIGILAAVLIAVINPVAQQNKAKDGVIKAGMGKVILAINTYNSAYGRWPTCAELQGELNTGTFGTFTASGANCTLTAGTATPGVAGKYDSATGEVSFPAQGATGNWYWSPTIGSIGVGTTTAVAF